MAKRFIDTGLFDDEWFMDLPKDAKILWVYFITRCTWAGIIKLNRRLCSLQTGIKSIDKTIKDLEKRIIEVENDTWFIPKFIVFQYNDFPNSKVIQQKSALKELEKYGLVEDGKVKCLTLTQESVKNSGTLKEDLPNS